MTRNPQLTNDADPHAGQPVLTAGPALAQTRAALVMLHGRGAGAQSILSLYDELGAPACTAFAPQAAGRTWYPQSFLAPIPANQPFLDSALRRVESLIQEILAQGVASEKIAILGFSQGACLTSESVARHPRHYGAVIALTGGVVGPPGTPRDYRGDLTGVPVFLGCGDPDPHVPFARVQETAHVLQGMGAKVDLRRYEGKPHGINEEELDAARALIAAMVAENTHAEKTSAHIEVPSWPAI